MSVPPPPPGTCPQRSLMSPGSGALRTGRAESGKPARGYFGEYSCCPACLPVAWTWGSDPAILWGSPLLLYPLLGNLYSLFFS